ncbi:MAG: Coenzyme F420 hydrogenase/dehydrogenase, beta subunit C-terminal domain [Bacteroidia bacterium]|nr:Coenzyme F420 hydrogenase/dehydrogenase, beta subunit C-terminal domain [Bacteroidia bacterium]
MISIIDKHNCCGCSACVQICPKQCITFEEDEKGFRYPSVDSEICVDCGLCEKVCPIITPNVALKPLHAYAAINSHEEIREQSSSGGVFTSLAEKVVKDGGVVFGAKFNDNWEVIHDNTETIEGLGAFRGSKYVQSVIGESYIKAEFFLKQGREVLFSGTPCQIAGLKTYLKKEYDNLITIDVICHGVPSPLVWRDYLSTIVQKYNTTTNCISRISFRDKRNGWHKYGLSIYSNVDNKNRCLFWEFRWNNIFMKLYMNDLCLRPSCHKCMFKAGASQSDITIADYWGVGDFLPKLDDNRGTSLLLANTAKGCSLLKDGISLSDSVNYKGALSRNTAYFNSPIEHKGIAEFWDYFFSNGLIGIERNILSKYKRPLKNRIVSWVKGILKKLTPKDLLNKYRKQRVKDKYEQI